MSRGRFWCFTLNNPVDELKFEDERVRYAIWQLERGANGTIHFQGYMEWINAMRLAACKTLIPGAHWEVRKGSAEQAKAYCSKEESRIDGPWEHGTMSEGQGTRTDLLAIKRKIDEGADDLTLWETDFGATCKYHKAFSVYRNLKVPDRNHWTELIVLIGPPGCGKSRFCHETSPQSYFKQRSQWWCGYDGRSDITIDDFYGWLPPDEILRIGDRFPLMVQCKGGNTKFAAKRVFITSNRWIDQWWEDPKTLTWLALYRRIARLLVWNRCNELLEFIRSDGPQGTPDMVAAKDHFNSGSIFIGF